MATYFICWKNTHLGMLEQALRAQYPLLTGEEIQAIPQLNSDGTWSMVGSSRLDEEKINHLNVTAEGLLAQFKAQGLAAPSDTLDVYLQIVASTPPIWWVDPVTEMNV